MKFNGLSGAIEGQMEVDAAKADSITNGTNVDSSKVADEPSQYNVSLWYEESDIQYMAIERIDPKKENRSYLPDGSAGTTSHATDASSEKTSTSNGSVTSVGPFSLLGARVSVASSNSSVVSHKATEDGKFTVPAQPSLPRTKQQSVTGVVALCDFAIDFFSKLKRAHVDDDQDDTSEVATTPSTGRGKGAAAKKNLNKTTTNAAASPDVTSKKRASGKRGHSDTEDEPKAKQIKTVAVVEEPAYSVLARWVDKLYYAGRVTQSKPGNKYVVLFEDGASKTLPQEHIVFGEDNVLPLLDQSVHALIAKDTYEPGMVSHVNKDSDPVMYTVTTESKSVTVSASDIYLEEDQAKMIQQSMSASDAIKSPDTPTTGGKRAGRPSIKLEESQTASGGRARGTKKTQQPSTPEPGTSGNVGGRSGRRAKRYS